MNFLKYLFLLVFAPHSTHTMEWRMLRYLNKDRKRHGLAKVFMQDDLRRVARKHSRDMAKNRYFSHTNLKARSSADRLKLAKITESMSGENLAMVGGRKNPTQAAQDGLMRSAGHRANILNTDFNCVGIGVVKSAEKIYYFTQNFAKRALLFKGGIKDKIRRNKPLNISAKTFPGVRQVLCEIVELPNENLYFQRLVRPKDRKFRLKIRFERPGGFEIRFFAKQGGAGRFHLVNHFKIRVKRGFFI